MTQSQLILVSVAQVHGNDPMVMSLRLAALLTQPRTEQIATLRTWIGAYRATRQHALDTLAAATAAQETQLRDELAAIDADTP